jgi:leukotriene-A4 hydrolase
MSKWSAPLLVFAAACRPDGAMPPPGLDPSLSAPVDPHSAAEPDRVVVRHVGASWTVDFSKRRLAGHVVLSVDRHDPSAPLRLDVRDLDVNSIAVAPRPPDLVAGAALAEVDAAWAPTTWQTGEPDPIVGAALSIDLPPDVTLVRVDYATTQGATGLQWLEPAQTAAGTAPFLYSQSQAIHARSWIPCQDTPAVRMTYDAVVHAPASLQPLMSADRLPARPDGAHAFHMPQPIPSYLIALAVGALEFRELGPRSGVWAEPVTLERAAWELADVERMIEVAESLVGPYRWGRYDLLVLPPAFPFGGMENPKLTFATPTILAGDRSLVALVAHELAHSWSGNLVTNSTWNDLWLNEGFTVYLERRIVEEIYGEARAAMEAALGRQDLARAVEELPARDQRLVMDLRGRDPDVGISDIPYEKGALLLGALERHYTRPVFDRFLRRWFDEHAFTSVDSAELERFVRAELLAGTPEVDPPDLDAWLHGTGVGPASPPISAEPFARVDAVADAFARGADPATLEVAEFGAHQWLRLLRAIPADLPVDRIADLDRAHRLTETGNAEILTQWLQIAIRHGHRSADARLEEFLLSVGRRKFLLPLYQSLLTAGRKDEALAIYRRARSGYHPITQRSLDELLADPAGEADASAAIE